MIPISIWKVEYTIKIGHVQKEEYDIDIPNPSDQELLDSPFYQVDKEKARRHFVKRKADEEITKLCNRLSVETKSPVRYEPKSFYFMRDGKKEHVLFVDEGEPIYIRQADFPSLLQKIYAFPDELDYYADLYNRSLESTNVFYQYTLLYLIAEGEIEADKKKKENKYIELRTIRNMLSHPRIDDPSLAKTADGLFDPGVRRIQLSDPKHQKVVRDHLPQLRKMAESIIRRGL